MNELNHEQLIEMINISYDTRTPLFVWGGVGIGKSQTIKEVARRIANDKKLTFSENEQNDKTFGFLDVRISQLEPSDLRGLPIQDKESNSTKWLIANWLPQNKDSQGIIFFDELNLSPPSIQAVAYQLILDRKVGDYELPMGWVIISAGNRIEDKCNVFEMSNALSNRFIHAVLSTPDKEGWSKWAMNNNIDGRIVAFVNFKPSSLNRIDDDLKDKAFPTPRSWAFCSRLISGQKDLNIIKRLVASSVGEATAIEFNAFVKLQTKIDLDDLFKYPKKIADIREIDLKYVLLGTIAERYKKDKKVLSKCFELCEHLQPEFSILLLRFLKAIDRDDFKKKVITDGKHLLEKYAEILKD
jgi:hypothetical protein